ncbi:hypothetical protein BY996DRAFT_8253991 [Phakopsora pachyrhizi]|uniref:Expressed protein n=1 Tax=Phakopsora pachyrhizi TaxID=170000 RepID=A0AAV0B3X2_PHAPC|nr:hypothetical protein BY996DRAFT_8253991 [Phakopsora pachyrhizi]CAH7681094.1 expressed protein [Phakopsora pachyrhizi]
MNLFRNRDSFLRGIKAKTRDKVLINRNSFRQPLLSDDVIEEEIDEQGTVDFQIRSSSNTHPTINHRQIQINITKPSQIARPIPTDWQTSLGPKKSVLRTPTQVNTGFRRSITMKTKQISDRNENFQTTGAPSCGSLPISLGGRSEIVRKIVVSSPVLKRAASRHM